jgi:hypothetical protein
MRVIEVAEELYNRINASKCVSKLSVSKDEFAKFINTIDATNNLPFDAVMYQDRLLSDWEIFVPFKDLFFPSAVRLFPDQKERSVDLLVRGSSTVTYNPGTEYERTVHLEVLNYSDFLNVQYSLAGSFKVNNPEFVKVDSLRTVVSAADAYLIADIEGLGVHWADNVGRIPYTVKNLGALKSSFCNATAEEVSLEWVRGFNKSIK